MSDFSAFPPPDADSRQDFDAEPGELQLSKQQIAHDRGRICKKRGCVVCQPLRDKRRAKKQQRKADAQAALHAKNKPCGRKSCELDRCKQARANAASSKESGKPDTQRDEQPGQQPVDPAVARRRQDEKHRIGLPCGSEDCTIQLCVDGFANERNRRHRKGRPCRSSTCTTPMCVAARASN